MSSKKKIIIIIISCLIIFSLYKTVILIADDKQENFTTYLKTFTEVLTFVRDEYVDEEKVNMKELIYGAIEGMLAKLDDPYTRFLPPKSYDDMKVETEGHFGGLGIEITIKDGVLTVVAPMFGTPAFEAGIKAGDQIIKIEGESTKDITIDDAVKKLRGKVGTKVTITIKREGFQEPIEFTIVRGDIKLNSVYSKMLTNDIGYIYITKFTMTTATELKKELDNLKENGIKKLILDLRNNPGGLLESAYEVSDLFLNDGLIVFTKTRGDKIDQKYFSHNDDSIFETMPLILLVNEGSASGAEIVTGAIKDRKRGIIIGKKTYGKGSVQTVRNLSGGAGIALTTAKYYTPSGICIHKEGIEPDITIEQPEYSKEELESFKKLIMSDTIYYFVDKNPNYTDTDVAKLIEDLEKENIKLPVNIIKSQIKQQEARKKGLKYFGDIESDNQLKKAVEIAKTIDIIKKMLK
ncbi:MAG TPA: S41 family peptidase [bacterium]|nr:S41 family peptidase [bacterium]HOL47255.1 S41 family peptidase [bacterium]HPQ19291.1 S41 family peptidase [bacterium]